MIFTMNYIKNLLPELIGRLPELEWKVTGLNPIVFKHNVPKKLFRSSQELTGAICINEIKADLHLLSKQENQPAALYLAEQVKHKINVLVGLCQISNRNKKPVEPPQFNIKMLTTRQQWLQSIEDDIHALTNQQQALSKALMQMRQGIDPSAALNLKAELGEVERRLTLAQEALTKATW